MVHKKKTVKKKKEGKQKRMGWGCCLITPALIPFSFSFVFFFLLLSHHCTAHPDSDAAAVAKTKWLVYGCICSVSGWQPTENSIGL